MADLILYHNPRCSKSREALKLLEDNDQDFSTFLYINENLNHVDLASLLDRLGISARELLRKNEDDYKSNIFAGGLPITAFIPLSRIGLSIIFGN